MHASRVGYKVAEQVSIAALVKHKDMPLPQQPAGLWLEAEGMGKGVAERCCPRFIFHTFCSQLHNIVLADLLSSAADPAVQLGAGGGGGGPLGSVSAAASSGGGRPSGSGSTAAGGRGLVGGAGVVGCIALRLVPLRRRAGRGGVRHGRGGGQQRCGGQHGRQRHVPALEQQRQRVALHQVHRRVTS